MRFEALPEPPPRFPKSDVISLVKNVLMSDINIFRISTSSAIAQK